MHTGNEPLLRNTVSAARVSRKAQLHRGLWEETVLRDGRLCIAAKPGKAGWGYWVRQYSSGAHWRFLL
ncbi:hypothetical protein CEXT_237621 [Caerostris extrusa]|uniref:Uncharacterized protein n=1 Tax=Caerostris extrusa TaxID=172846 RepID=A0AAV4UCT1_CAEEX|nr:hypothetical protein CEXT_237621 [Caerostris extrusa]